MAKGGKRPSSGRKAVKDKKVQVSAYIRQSIIKGHGGYEAIVNKIYEAVGQTE